MGQHPPLATAPEHVEDGVDDLSSRVLDRLRSRLGAGTSGSRISHCSLVRSVGYGFLLPYFLPSGSMRLNLGQIRSKTSSYSTLSGGRQDLDRLSWFPVLRFNPRASRAAAPCYIDGMMQGGR